MTTQKELRCAIYTRKSCEDGLELEYNSLDAQYDAAAAYIRSQVANGWLLLPKHYDDGGFSGGNVNRPALKELLSDIEAGQVDIVVVYKIDRLSRSLCDFADLSRTFERHGVSFVSVTQQIDTSNPAGRMLLNILMTFAQFEREMTSDRIRDKVLATRKKGLWSGGTVPYGYRAIDKRLVPELIEADAVRYIFKRYAEVASVKTVLTEIIERFGPNRGQKPWNASHVYRTLNNALYKGDLPHKRTGQVFKGVHEPLVDETLWNDCQRILHEATVEAPSARRETTAVLKGLLRCGHCGGAMSPSFSTKRKGLRYSYYVCNTDTKRAVSECPVRRIAGETIERLVFNQLGLVLGTAEFARLVAEQCGWPEDEAVKALNDIRSLLNAMTPAEQERLLRCLVEEIVVKQDGIDIDFKTNGMTELTKEMLNGGYYKTS